MNPQHDEPKDDNVYLLPTNKIAAVLQPLSPTSETTLSDDNAGSSSGTNPAAELIRSKIDALYTSEPDAAAELSKVEHPVNNPSKHQKFMLELSNSGKPMADIQTEWHNYYVALPDAEKHQVWKEFYTYHAAFTQNPRPALASVAVTAASVTLPRRNRQTAAGRTKPDRRTLSEIKNQLVDRVQANAQPQKSRSHSALFGLGLGVLMLLVLMFGFFNERFVVPFISPSKTVSATSIIIDLNSTAVGPEPKVIIPKINVEIPVVYDQPSTDEKIIQQSLEQGAIHYPTTAKPGEKGNTVIFGHSSNNILNKGKYKFAFVLLNRLNTGDVFYLNRGGTRYAYRVYEKKIVKPSEISVLNPTDKPATASLITCDPPGTSINRLVVIGEQISPDPGANIVSTNKPSAAQPKTLPSNAPSLWARLTGWISS